MWPLLIFLITLGVLFYHRAALRVQTTALLILGVLVTSLSNHSVFYFTILWLLLAIFLIPLNVRLIRRRITQLFLKRFLVAMPKMSRTEREAIAAGSVGWEAELFAGKPHFDKLFALQKPTLSTEEQAFLAGPVETLCSMINDWQITHVLTDLPEEMWQFLKSEGFFGLVIPKNYGGKGFSAYAHSEIITKLSGRSIGVTTTVSVPNSLGPAELLLHYGTEAQKDYYLPRLVRGDEIPCFALTAKEAGSDASAMVDTGIVCQGEFQGSQTLGIRLNWNKRYITLAPIATVIGLAFKLYDPEHLLGTEEDLGITCALIPRDTAGITIGRRHFPLNTAFLNGPIQGKDVFIPIDWIIGGVAMAGQGWRMLMECLAVGRAISLPAMALGGSKMLCHTSGAYARIRSQFHLPIGYFEGVAEALARMISHTYIMDATRNLTAAMIDQGAKPAIASAITKYHVTEMGRTVGNDGMDIHGGKGICLGPKNYIGRGYQTIPVSITVEGANILTRNMIIFGQGAMRCHPYLFAEMEAININDPTARLKAFDQAIWGHLGYFFSSFCRVVVLCLTNGLLVHAPKNAMRRYYQWTVQFSSVLSLLSESTLFFYGGSIKRHEAISARLGDILSYLYLLTAVLKHYVDQGEHVEDVPLAAAACQWCLQNLVDSAYELICNLPSRSLSLGLRMLVFPYGKGYHKTGDEIRAKLATLLLEPNATRDRVTHGISEGDHAQNPWGKLQAAMVTVIAAESAEKKLYRLAKDGKISGISLRALAEDAKIKLLILLEEYNHVIAACDVRESVLAVDDFADEELRRG